MAKNFATLYASGNDAIALEQKVFVKEESTRGTFMIPTGADFTYQLAGDGLTFERPADSSPVRSGRHNTTVIQGKDKTTFAFPTYFMIDSSLGSASVAEIDPAMRVLWKSLLGREVTSPNLKYDSVTDPQTTFSLLINGDMFAQQSPGCFVEAGDHEFPGDGRATSAWNGSGKTMYRVGIGKSVTANAGNAITLASGEGLRFDPEGGLVMVVHADGTTRSSDTPTGSARNILSVVGDVVTVDGAALTDSDGTSSPVYLCYYEPTGIVAINDPQTGLVGSISVNGLSTGNVRKIGLKMTNNHELANYYFGTRGLAGPLFVPGGRLACEVSLELNMNHALLGWINGLKSFTGHSLTWTLGPASGRRAQFDVAKAIFGIPPVKNPETGSVPVTFTGMAYQSALDAADEIVAQFK